MEGPICTLSISIISGPHFTLLHNSLNSSVPAPRWSGKPAAESCGLGNVDLTLNINRLQLILDSCSGIHSLPFPVMYYFAFL